jgi:hypothetical protein
MANATNTAPGSVALSGDLSGSVDPYKPELRPTGVTPGSYGNSAMIVNGEGRVISANSQNLVSIIDTYLPSIRATPTVPGVVVVPGGSNISVSNGSISVPVATQTTVGVASVQSGGGLTVTNGEVSFDLNVLPNATTTVQGIVRVPESGRLVVDNGDISVPTANTDTFGVVIDNGNMVIDANGTLSLTRPNTTTTVLGVASIGSGINVDANGLITINSNTIPFATTSLRGRVIVGDNINVANGLISVANTSESTNGAVIVGNGLIVNANTMQLFYNPATGSELGYVTNSNTIHVLSDGTLQWNSDNYDTFTASTNTFGFVKFDDVTIVEPSDAAWIFVNIDQLPKATNTEFGVVQVVDGDELSINANNNLVITLPTGNANTSGIVFPDNETIKIEQNIFRSTPTYKNWLHRYVQIMPTGIPGLVDSTSATGSCWLTLDPTGANTERTLLWGANGNYLTRSDGVSFGRTFGVRITNTNKLEIFGYNDFFTASPSFRWISTTDVPHGVRFHLAFSFRNAPDGSGLRERDIYIDDQSVPGGTIWSDRTINFGCPRYFIGARVIDDDMTTTLHGSVDHLWFASDLYMDLSDVNNRRKFITSDFTPAPISANSALSTGEQAGIYFSSNVNNWWSGNNAAPTPDNDLEVDKSIFAPFDALVYESTIINPTEVKGFIYADRSRSDVTYGVARVPDSDFITITSGEIDLTSNVAYLTSNRFKARQTVTPETANVTSSVTPNFANTNVLIYTLTGNTTINNPTNVDDGGQYTFVLKQDNVGGRVVLWGTDYKFEQTPVLSTNANAIDIVISRTGFTGNVYCQLLKDFK